MRWKRRVQYPSPDPFEWHSYFCWLPKLLGDQYVWLETIECRLNIRVAHYGRGLTGLQSTMDYRFKPTSQKGSTQ
jgi:hypothetical protein